MADPWAAWDTVAAEGQADAAAPDLAAVHRTVAEPASARLASAPSGLCAAPAHASRLEAPPEMTAWHAPADVPATGAALRPRRPRTRPRSRRRRPQGRA